MNYLFICSRLVNRFFKITILSILSIIGCTCHLYAQKDTPCECAQRWEDGGHWNVNGTVNDDNNAPDPKGIIRCGSSAETQSGIKAGGCVYNSVQFQISPSGCKNPDSGLSVSVNPPTAGCPVIWLNFDQRPGAGSYQYQIISSDNYSWALYYSDEHQTGVDANNLSGDCSDLVYYACGNSFSGWATFTTPSFLQATNIYVAIWNNSCGTQNGFSVIFKARYGCGDADVVLCNVESGNPAVSCNSNGTYTVNIPINGSNGNYQGSDPSASPTTSNIVTLTNLGSGGPTSGTITMTYPQSITTYNVLIKDVVASTGDIIPSNPDSCMINVTGNRPDCCSLLNCDDSNACTTDGCSNNTCSHTTVDCNDSNACSTDGCDTQAGCTHATVNCDDTNVCTTDACDSQIGCTYSDVNCDDNNACTLDGCDSQTGCTHAAVNCDDTNVCTMDACDSQTGCTYSDVNCDDNNACTLDGCDAQSGCTHTTVNCDDNNACTNDACNSQTGCTNAAVNCNDNDACTNDNCEAGICMYTPACNDNNLCTTDLCRINGACLFPPVNCDDNNFCTIDACNPSNGNCIHPARNCDDGFDCTIDNCLTQCIHDFSACDTTNNPQIACPSSIIFVLDESGSIDGFGQGTVGVTSEVRNGCIGLLNALVGTDAKVAIVEFNTQARRALVGGTTAYQTLNSSTVNDFIDYINDGNSIPDSIGFDPEDFTVSSQRFTNWEAALMLVQKINSTEGTAGLVLFFTDGMPTAYISSNGGAITGSSQTIINTAISEATAAANLVKLQGSHLFVVGFPNPDLPEANVQAISGPNKYPNPQPSFILADYSIETSSSLESSLGNLGNLICRADLRLSMKVQPTATCPGNTVTFTIKVTNDGYADADTVIVKNYIPIGYTYLSDDGGASTSFAAGTLTWNVGDLIYTESDSVKVTMLVNASGNLMNAAEVTYSNRNDSDSEPSNFTGAPAEDDEAVALLSYPDCSDGNLCTDDFCLNGDCSHSPVNCNDGSTCTSDQCIEGTCDFSPINCNDADECTVDGCIENTGCTHSAANCNDNNICTDDGCLATTGCSHGAVNCNDSDACTDDSCNPIQGCQYAAHNCNDNDACTDDSCDKDLGCQYAAHNCDDNDACTDDSCDRDSGCQYAAHDCDDNDACTDDSCNGDSGCQYAAHDCDDNDACTDDSCDKDLGCKYAAHDCNDLDACTDDPCNPPSGCQYSTQNCNDSDACTDDSCDKDLGCQYAAHDCDDNDACTDDSCDRGSGCQYAAHDCNDNDACTDDSCDKDLGCQYAAHDCNDLDACTDDLCNPPSGCQYSTQNCNDSNACTDDSCNPLSGCQYSTHNCNDQVACTSDNCDVTLGCRHTSISNCCVIAGDCNDQNLCTDDECVTGSCENTPHNCNDNDACMDDFCNPQSGCQHSAHNCNDNDACTDDSCDKDLGCWYANHNCDDEKACTNDDCNSATGCVYTSLNCNDGSACTHDGCDDLGGCVHSPIDCNDNDACTDDSCDPASGCQHSKRNCDDSNFCTDDSCNPLLGCQYAAHSCNDNNACTIDGCSNGQCSNILKNCDDQNSCTIDACVNGDCTHTPKDCSDNDACTADLCNNGVCSNVFNNCDDNDPSTLDACANGECVNTSFGCDTVPLKIIFVLDESGSIAGSGTGTSNISAQVRSAVSGILNSLTPTITEAAVIEFNTNARRAVIGGTTAFQPVSSAIGGFLNYINDNNTTPGSNNYDPEDYLSNKANTFTNWEAALLMVQSINNSEGVAPLVLFFTDGIPTAYNTTNGVTTGSTTAIKAQALSEAVTVANIVKDQGSHIFVISLPNPTLPESNIQQISGLNRYPDIEPNFTDADYSISTSSSLESDLTNIGSQVCRQDSCQNASDCDDVNPCTTDECNNGTCSSAPINCDDNDACTTDQCNNGQCAHAPIPNCGNPCDNVNCDDGNACTTDGCNNGQCTHTALNCSDNNACTTDACNNGQCLNTPINCDDNNACTTDACSNGLCSHTPINCNDNNACTTDACNNGQCSNTPVNCNDNNSCTIDACSNGQCQHTPDPQCQPCTLEVVSLTLINSSTDQDIRPLNATDTINLFNTPNITVRANLCVEPVGSVRFFLNNVLFRNENSMPYSIAGDAGADYTKWNVAPGLYVLKATPYSGTNGGGTTGTSKTVSLLVINQQSNCTSNAQCNDNNACTNDVCTSGICSNTAISCNDNNTCTTDACVNGVCTNTIIQRMVTSFTLINSATDLDIGPLNNGAVINLTQTPDVTVRANLCTNTGTASVKFSLNGSQFKIEGGAPWALAGDASGNYTKWNVTAGAYTIQAIPYSGANATGTAGTGLSVTISVINGSAKMSDDGTREINVNSGRSFISAYPNPFRDQLNFEFSVDEDSRVSIELFSMTGAKIAVIFEGTAESTKTYKETFNPGMLSKGVYVYRMKTNNTVIINKVIFAR